MRALRKGTTSWRETTTLAADEVEFAGEFLYEADGLTPAMVWDAALQNVRPFTQAERDAKDESRKTARVRAAMIGSMADALMSNPDMKPEDILVAMADAMKKAKSDAEAEIALEGVKS